MPLDVPNQTTFQAASDGVFYPITPFKYQKPVTNYIDYNTSIKTNRNGTFMDLSEYIALENEGGESYTDDGRTITAREQYFTFRYRPTFKPGNGYGAVDNVFDGYQFLYLTASFEQGREIANPTDNFNRALAVLAKPNSIYVSAQATIQATWQGVTSPQGALDADGNLNPDPVERIGIGHGIIFEHFGNFVPPEDNPPLVPNIEEVPWSSEFVLIDELDQKAFYEGVTPATNTSFLDNMSLPADKQYKAVGCTSCLGTVNNSIFYNQSLNRLECRLKFNPVVNGPFPETDPSLVFLAYTIFIKGKYIIF
jgi:hypothetical protein